MTVAVEEELRNRISVLEADVAMLRKALERWEIQAAIRRGKDEADRGLVIPARELVAKLRTKHGLPTT